MVRKEQDILIKFKAIFTDVDKNTKKGTDELKKFKKEAEKSGIEIEKAGKKADKSSKNFNKVEKSTKKAGTSMLNLNKILTRFVGFAAVALGIREFLTANALFETRMSNISTLMIGQEKEVDNLRKGIISLSESYPKTADELGAAAYDIVSAGIEGSVKQLEALEASTKLAIGGLGTTTQAVDLVTSSLNSFSKEGLSAAEVSETLFRAVKGGKTTVAQLSQGFGGVAGTVAATGISFKEFIAQVSAMTTVGLPASQAYSQLRAVIAGLTRETDQSREIFDALGAKNLPDLIEKSGGFTEALKLIREETNNDNAAMLKLVGSTEALNAVIALTDNVNTKFTSTLANMNEEMGELNKAVEKQNKTLANQYILLKNKLNAEMLKLGDVIIPRAMESIDNFIGRSDEATEGLTRLQKAVALVATVIKVSFTLIILAIETTMTAFSAFFTLASDGYMGYIDVLKGTAKRTIEVLRGLGAGLALFIDLVGQNLEAGLKSPISAVKIMMVGMVNFIIAELNSLMKTANKLISYLPESVKDTLGLTEFELKIDKIELPKEVTKDFKSFAELGKEIKENFDFTESAKDFEKAGVRFSTVGKKVEKNFENLKKDWTKAGSYIAEDLVDVALAYDDEYQERKKVDEKIKKSLDKKLEDVKKHKAELIVLDKKELKDRINIAEKELKERKSLLTDQLKEQGRTEEEITKLLDRALKGQTEQVKKAKKDLADSENYKAQYKEMDKYYSTEEQRIEAREKTRQKNLLRLESDLVLQGKTEKEIEIAKKNFLEKEIKLEEEKNKKYLEYQDIQIKIAEKDVEINGIKEEGNELAKTGVDSEKEKQKLAEDNVKLIEKAYSEYEKGINKVDSALSKINEKQTKLLKDFEKEIRSINQDLSNLTGKTQTDLVGLIVNSKEEIAILNADLAKETGKERRTELQAEIQKLQDEITSGKKFLDEVSEGKATEIVKEEEVQRGKTEAERIKEQFDAEKEIFEERKEILEALKNGEKINLEEISDIKNKEYAIEQEEKIQALTNAKELEIANRKEVEMAYLEAIKNVEQKEMASIQRRSGAYRELINNITEAIQKYDQLIAINKARAEADPPQPQIPVYHEGGEVNLRKHEGIALLQNKEFVVRKDIAQANMPALQALNAGQSFSSIIAKAMPTGPISNSNSVSNRSTVYNENVEINLSESGENAYDIYDDFLIPRTTR